MKILILTLSVFDGGTYTNFFQTQNQTWNSVEVEGVQTFFYVGNSSGNTIEDNVIKTDVIENLYACGEKTLKAFELIKDYDYDYIFRTNSSSYVDKKLLKQYLEDKPRDMYYSGLIGNYNGLQFASGSGFSISKNVVDLILQNKSMWNHSLIDDVALANLLKMFGVKPTHSPRFDVTLIDKYTPLDFFHYRFKSPNRDLDLEKMRILHKMKLEKNG